MPDIKKEWYHSKTIWVNIIAMIVILIQAYAGFVVSAEEQAAVIVIINLLLRAITKTQLETK